MKRPDISLKNPLMGVNQVKSHPGYLPVGKVGEADSRQPLREGEYRYFVKNNIVRLRAPLVGKNVNIVTRDAGKAFGQLGNKPFASPNQSIFRNHYSYFFTSPVLHLAITSSK